MYLYIRVVRGRKKPRFPLYSSSQEERGVEVGEVEGGEVEGGVVADMYNRNHTHQRGVYRIASSVTLAKSCDIDEGSVPTKESRVTNQRWEMAPSKMPNRR